jgi:phosphomannomutase/phosphoglucomutase
MATLKRTMFREYDIRGKEAPDELNDESVYQIVRGFGKMLRDKEITDCIVGHDARATSESFHAQALKALTESGINCIDIGTVTTPMSYFAQYHFKVKGLCMITASHNPAEWNGMKLGLTREGTLLATEIAALYERVVREDYVSGTGSVREEEIRETYYEDVLSRVTVPKKLKLLINTGNGTVGPFATTLFKKAGYEIVEHNTTPDPSHPNYTPNPDGTAMMGDTGVQAVKHGCHVGVAFDGDGDRLGITDEKGNIIWPDRYLILLSRHILKKYPGAKIIFDVKVSEALPEDIAAHGGDPIMWTTGNS